MFLYDTNAGLKIPSHIKNNSPNFPIVKLQENAAQGFGFFTSKGVDGTSLDTNVSHTDAEKYLRNLPAQKRCKGYVAVLLAVDLAEVGGAFVQSSVPAVYIYKGGVDAQGNVSDSDWRTDTNWMLVQAGTPGSGNIAQNLEGVTQQTTSSINFLDVANVTNVTFTGATGDANTANAFQFDIATDFARSDQNFYLGAKATAFASGSTISAANGVQILSEGSMVFKKDNVAGSTTIAGGAVTLNNLNANGTIEAGGIFRAGALNEEHSTMSSTLISTASVSASTRVTTPLIEAPGTGDIMFKIPTSLEPAFVIATSDDFNPGGESTTAAAGISQIYTNAALRILHAPEDTQLEYLYGVGQDGKVVKIERGLIASGASAFQQGFGITITNPDSDNPGLQVNQNDVVTIATNQTIPATKEIGQIILTGNTSVSDSDVDGLRFNEGALDNISEQSETPGNINLLYVINNQASNRHGTVYRGVSGSSFIDSHTSFSDRFRVSNNLAANTLNISLKDVYVKSDADDASVFKFRSKRLGAHSFTPAEISAELTAHENTTDILNQQTSMAEDATIIEWVREFGDYVNGSSADIATRRSSGVIMKSGFTSATNPYTAQGILDSKFRFSAKQAAVAELTSGDEELGGTVTFTVPSADTTYAAQNSNYAIQIGTQSTSASVGDRLNEVSIPNLLVKNLTVPNDGSSYIGGGGTFGGNWTFSGDVTVSGVLTATNASNSLGSTSTGTLATTASLLQLGSPSASATGDFNEREIGIVGLFNYDGDNDGVVDDNEAMATTFFRDNSESGVAEIFGRSAANIGAGGGTDNHHRPWKLMTSVEKINTLGTSIDTTEEFFPTALEVGGIRLRGYDPNNATNYSTKFFNRVVTNIADAATAEAGSSDDWEGGGTALTGALASAAAIKAYVDNEISGVGGFSSTDLGLGTFSFGVTQSADPVSATNTYTPSQADRIFIQDTGSSDAVAAALPEDLGLALHADSTESLGSVNRPDVGWLPGATPLGKGTALRTIVNKVFTAPSLPEITNYDDNNNVFKTAVSLFERYPTNPADINGVVYLENGFDDFGDNSQSDTASDFSNVEGVSLRVINAAGIDEMRHIITIPTGVTLTDADGGTVTSTNVPIILAGVSIPVAGAPIVESVTPTLESDGSLTSLYYLNLALDGANSADKAFKNDGQIELSATKPQAIMETKIQITALADEFAGFTSPNPVERFNYHIRRRSFMFVSNLDVRMSVKGAAGTSIVDDGLDLTIAGAFATMDGTKAASQTNSSYSNKFMHYLIATATSDTSDVLDSGDIVEDSAGADITFPTGTYGLLGRNTSGSLEEITQVKVRNVIVGTAGGAANTPLSSTSVTHIPYVSGNINIQRYPGMLAELKGAVGSSQYWPRSTATTSSDGFLYRAVPISFAGAGVASSWLNGSDSLFQVDAALGTTDDLLRDGDGNLLTFTMTNQYGVDTEYVLFQSTQTLDNEPAVGKFGDIVEV